MRFDRIEQAVLDGHADCGVLIHEGRFTYEAKGLTLLTTTFAGGCHYYFFTIDFNRHSKTPIGTKQDTPSLNVLYCDGHASTVSAREAYRALRFR